MNNDYKIDDDGFVILNFIDLNFDLKNSIDWQMTKLNLVLEKEIPPEKRGDLEYIDLRFGEAVIGPTWKK